MAKEQILTLSQIHKKVTRNPNKFFLVRVLKFKDDIPHIPQTCQIAACTDTHEEVLTRLAELREQGTINRWAIFGSRLTTESQK